MSLPGRGEIYQRFTEHLRLAQEDAATLAHLHADDQVTGRAKAMGFLAISEALKEMQHNVMLLATKGRVN